MINLAINARAALADGGTIRITAGNVADAKDLGLQGAYVRLDIAGDGVCMPPEILARGFEPFFTTQEVGGGSGLGLAQAHGFARASAGLIKIESALGSGTTVSLLLPARGEHRVSS